jgi:hypothetical protein
MRSGFAGGTVLNRWVVRVFAIIRCCCVHVKTVGASKECLKRLKIESRRLALLMILAYIGKICKNN